MYKLKKGYLLGKNFQDIVSSLQDNVDISWYEPVKLIGKQKLDAIFWTNIDQALKCDYFVIDTQSDDQFELGVVWTINYIRKMLIRSGHKDAVKQLDKFDLVDKNIIGLAVHNKRLISVAIKDQGKEFQTTKAIVSYIRNKEK